MRYSYDNRGSRAQRLRARPNGYAVDTIAFEALVGLALDRDQRGVFALREAGTGRLTKGGPASQKRQNVSFPCDSDPRAGLDACERDTCEVERRLIERSAVEGSVDTECLAQPPWSRAETAWIGCFPPFSHDVDAIDRLKCPDQNGADLGATDKIETPMDAVAAIDIGISWRSEGAAISRGLSAISVGRRISGVVCLRLDDRTTHAIDEEGNPNQAACDRCDVLRKKAGLDVVARRSNRALGAVSLH